MTRPLRSNILIFIAVFASERDKNALDREKANDNNSHYFFYER